MDVSATAARLDEEGGDALRHTAPFVHTARKIYLATFTGLTRVRFPAALTRRVFVNPNWLCQATAVRISALPSTAQTAALRGLGGATR